jgi:transcriptional regulator with XRE-family HTH domain
MTNERVRNVDVAVTAVLRAEAAAQKITWPKLGELSGVPSSSVSNYLNDVTPLPLARLDAMASALGMDLVEVMSRVRERIG